MKLNLAINELTRIKENAEYNSGLHERIGDEKQAALCLEVATQCHDALRVLKIVQAILCAGCSGNPGG